MKAGNASAAVLFRLGVLLIAAGPAGLDARSPQATPAQIEVHGLGWLGDREQRSSLERLLGRERGQTLDANAIEDAAFLLVSALIEQGYLKPVVETELTARDGHRVTLRFDAQLATTVPRPFAATRLDFHIRRGVRYRFAAVHLTGLHAISPETGREFFLGQTVLFARGSARAYSPAHLEADLDNLENELRRKGYAEATAKATNVRLDDRTGRVALDVQVTEGAWWQVAGVRLEAGPGAPPVQQYVGQPWSRYWQQDTSSAIRQHYLERGYPDVSLQFSREDGARHDDIQPVSVVIQVNPGPLVRVGRVRFEGAKHTKESVLRRRVLAEPGQLLNVAAMNQARFRLARLGVFDSVDLHYEPPTGPVRDPVFVLKEGRQLAVNLLAGYGSYEELRGGVELRQYNLFGRAYQTRLQLVQSMKGTRGEYTFTVPELFGESVDGTARAFGLQRQEISFLRKEYGVTTALSTPLRAIGATATLGYTFQSLQNRDNQLGVTQKVNSGSVDTNIVGEHRDNPLRPRHGYRWFIQASTASRLFGGGVDYQRLEFGGSYHTPWGRGRWLHFGLTHGVVTTLGGSAGALPLNELFYPGGDNSIRGYQVGQAAPIGPDGKYIGAKTYLLVNLELEQALTDKWSVVVFTDGIGTAARLADYPFSERLYSAGLGIRYQTLIGPLRMEYGRNLNPRSIDPRGTLLFSVGFPF